MQTNTLSQTHRHIHAHTHMHTYTHHENIKLEGPIRFKNNAWQNIMRKSTTGDATELVSCCPSIAIRCLGPLLKSDLYTQWDFVQETNFSLSLIVGDRLWVKKRGFWPHISALEPHVRQIFITLCIPPESMRVHMCSWPLFPSCSLSSLGS